jgi:hypothetical protein
MIKIAIGVVLMLFFPVLFFYGIPALFMFLFPIEPMATDPLPWLIGWIIGIISAVGSFTIGVIITIYGILGVVKAEKGRTGGHR